MKKETSLYINDSTLNDFLQENDVGFFSISVFDKKNNALVALCNHEEWQNIFKSQYIKKPPVQKFITQKRNNGLIWWDKDLYGKDVNNYVSYRNEVCNIKTVITQNVILHNLLFCFTFGSKENQSHLVNILSEKNIFIFKETLAFLRTTSQCKFL